MSRQQLDLRISLQILHRRLTTVGIAAALCFLAGGAYTELNVPLHAATALVVLPATTANTGAEVLIADSTPVLERALGGIEPAMSLPALRSRIQVTNITTNLISITAQAGTATRAEQMANAVADSYVTYVGAPNTPAGQVPTQVVQYATNATGVHVLVRLLSVAFLGALAGMAIGAVVVLAIGRNDRRLRQRDLIADAIGVPVLASVPVRHPRDAARWIRLLDDYVPSVADASRLRSALHELGLAEITSRDEGAGSSLTVLSFSFDQLALALGPQLAVFADSLGISTALVIGPQQESKESKESKDTKESKESKDTKENKTAAALRAAASSSSRRSGRLQVTSTERHDLDQQPHAMLTIVVSVVDAHTPQLAHLIRTDAMVLGVSAGAATAEQLARIAASAAADNRRVAGILVADPDPADPTTGRLPQLARPTQTHMPTRLAGALR
jgi:capsular polysaccharide biosynthesis protein